MQISALIVGMALFTAAVVFVSRPFWEKRNKGVKESETNKRTDEPRDAVLTALRDLDFDYKIGKVGEEDYQPLRAKLLVEAAKYIEAQKQEDDQLEALIQIRRKMTQNVICEHCGAAMENGQKFCSKCGSSIATQACPSCGKKLHMGDSFCSSCGTKVEIQMRVAANS